MTEFEISIGILRRMAEDEDMPIVSGQASDWADYKRRVGRRSAFHDAIEALREYRSKINSGDFDDEHDEPIIQ